MRRLRENLRLPFPVPESLQTDNSIDNTTPITLSLILRFYPILGFHFRLHRRFDSG